MSHLLHCLGHSQSQSGPWASLDRRNYKEFVAISNIPYAKYVAWRKYTGIDCTNFVLTSLLAPFLILCLFALYFTSCLFFILSFIHIMKLSLILLFIRPYYNLQLAFLFLYLGRFVSKKFPPSFVWISVTLSCDLTVRSAGSCYLVWPALSPRASSTFMWWKEGVPACQSGRQELPPHAPWEHSLLVSSLWFDWWTFTPLSWKETKTPELEGFGRNMIFVVCFFSQVAGKWNRSNCKNEHWCPYQLERSVMIRFLWGFPAASPDVEPPSQLSGELLCFWWQPSSVSPLAFLGMGATETSSFSNYKKCIFIFSFFNYFLIWCKVDTMLY